MLETNNFGLQKPEKMIDNVDIDVINGNMDVVDKGLVLYLGITSGTANAYTVVSEDIKNLAEGAAVCVKFHAAASSASSLNINGWGAKAIKKTGGADVTNLKASMYTLRYDGTNFILQGEGASGNATASDLLLNKTATTDAGDITGVMPNNGAVNQSLSINGTYNIPAGYHNGSGKVTQSVPTKSAATYTPSTSDQTIAAGQYLSGAQTIKGDANLVPAKILTGNTIFGVAGNGTGVNNCAQISGLAGVFGSTVQGRVTLNWTNPTDGLFKGVRIIYKAGSYPAHPTDGSFFYDSNGADGPASTAAVNLTEGITYYFRAFAYTYLNATRIYTTTTAGAQVTGMPYRTQGAQTFTSSGTFTVPANVTTIDIFCGGGGASGMHKYGAGGGGGAGYTATKKNHAVTPGQQLAVVIGAGGGLTAGIANPGSATTFGGSVLTANGGSIPSGSIGGKGGSGGGGGNGSSNGGAGGSDGSNGTTTAYAGGVGQGSTTRAFAEAGNTLYAGGGGGGGNPPGTGGAGGGGNGADGYSGENASPGTVNTGGGGGSTRYATSNAGAGGSGICIVRWGY